ncbi:MAG: hypothetical protein ACXVEE_23805 [Polyangiales bacterium]
MERSTVATLAFVLFGASLVGCGGKFVAFEEDGGSSDTGSSGDTGGSSDTGSGDTGFDSGGCTPAECGPAPGIPAEKCWDGTYAGAICGRTAAGTCGWMFTTCPPSRCDSSASCAPKGFCDTPAGICGGSGTCTLTPEACGKNYQPTCGCDHVTYGNPCLLAKAGVSKLNDGPCEMPPPPPGKSCGGFGGDSCSSSEWCQYTGGGCGFADGGGTCKPRPEGCTDIYAPVCGCDYKTYGNECDAHMNGVDVQYTGVCGK